MKKTRVTLLVVMIFFQLITVNQNLSAQGLEQDSLALVALFDSTDGANWTDNTNWLTQQPVSKWFGVTVSSGRVSQVRLSGNNLVGKIPPEIGNLTDLIILRLNVNQLSGTIPPEIGNMTNLVQLWLQINELSGTIPVEIGNLINMSDLLLNTNQLSGVIPAEIGNLAALTRLELSRNQFSGSIASEIGNLTNLTSLRLFNNALSGLIPSALGNLTNLTLLDLRVNQLSGSIPTEITSLINLTFLGLRTNQLSGSIPGEISNLTNLTQLDLHENQFSGSIPSEIGNMTNLTTLWLFNNGLSGLIPSELGNLTNLEELRLDDNQLSGEIPTEISNLTNLTILTLFGNQLSGQFPSAITNLTLLQNLWLYDNRFIDLPDLSSITTLTNLAINNNKFTFEDIEPNIGIPTFIYSPQDSLGTRIDTTITEGTSLMLSISVGGTANHYQWMKDGVDIPGADSSSYTIGSVNPSDAGSYMCRIANTIATELALFTRPINVTVEAVTAVDNHPLEIPKAFVLYQNYPNPFNPTTTIKYDLPRASQVILKIYNLFGQEITTLVNEFQTGGEQTILWGGLNDQSKKVSSGIYIYQIRTKSFSKSKKMIMLR